VLAITYQFEILLLQPTLIPIQAMCSFYLHFNLYYTTIQLLSQA